MRWFLLTCFLLFHSWSVTAQSAWINEFHYDNAGVDSLEFIEVVFPLQNLSRSDYFILLYDGISGFPYDSASLDRWVAGDTVLSYAFFTWYPDAIQNGPDGIALGCPDSLIQFLSYEGALMASSGLADGITAQLLPIQEAGNQSDQSLQLTGSGSRSDQFWWTESWQSPGTLNTGQEFTKDPVLQYFGRDSVDFGQIPAGMVSLVEPVVIAGSNLYEDLFITIPEGFEGSFDAAFSTFFDTGTHQVPLANDFFHPDTLYLRFHPGTGPGRIYDDSLTFTSSGNHKSIFLQGKEGPFPVPKAWINEIHYDNESTDTNEFIELVISDQYLEQLPFFSLHLYNGNNGLEYKQSTGDAWEIGYHDPEGYTYVTAMIRGIQNGAADGIALAYRFRLIQFLSYEGTLTALDGPARDVTSTDIGVMEETDSPVNSSLQLVGTGGQYDDFTWVYFPGEHTMNQPNHDQVLPVVLKEYRLNRGSQGYEIVWTSVEEYRHAWYTLELSEDGIHFAFIARFTPAETLPHTYTYPWPMGFNGYIRLVQEDTDGHKTYYQPLASPSQGTDQQHHVMRVHSLQGVKVLEEMTSDSSRASIGKYMMPLPDGIYIIGIFDGQSWRYHKVLKR